MEPYQAILFDFDMTLADSVAVIARLLHQTAEHFGYPAKTHAEMLAIAGKGYTHERMLHLTTGETNRAQLMDMRAYYRQISQEQMPRMTPFFPGVPELLQSLHQSGIKLAVVSQKMLETLMACLSHGNLTAYFQVVLGCEDVPAPKPDPSGLMLAASRLQVAPSRCLFVGDSLIDQQAASKAGMDFAAMLKGATTKAQFDAQAARWYFASATQMLQAFTSRQLRGQ